MWIKKTVDKNELAKLLKDGMTISKAARALGVSRQAIHHSIKANGFKVLNKYGPHEQRTFKSRLITGGVAAKLNTVMAGRISEMLVAADLLARGWQVFLPLAYNSRHDIIAVREKRIITVEVRSARRTTIGLVKYAKKSHDTSDHYGLAIAGEPIQYEPPLD